MIEKSYELEDDLKSYASKLPHMILPSLDSLLRVEVKLDEMAK